MTALPDPLPVEPLAAPFDVALRPPGSKSLTNRAYVLAALAAGESRIIRPLRADDCDRLLDALVTLGAQARSEGDDVLVKGVGGRFPRGGTVDLGDGGTPTRFMIAAACLADAPVVVDGSPRMRERPIAEGIAMLRGLGATIEYLETDGQLPVRVQPSSLRGGTVEVGRTASSQFISGVLLIAPLPWPRGASRRDGTTDEPVVSAAHDGHAARLGRHCRRRARCGGDHDRTDRPRRTADRDRGRCEQRRLCGRGDGHRSGRAAADRRARTGFIPAGSAGGRRAGHRGASRSTATGPMRSHCGGPDRLLPIDADLENAPDGALAVAAACARGTGVSTITGLRTLRVKESDRIAALHTELERLGCSVRSSDDSITIDPAAAHDRPVVIETYGDHRIAMAFAVLGLVRPGLAIRDPACVAKSHPGFWAELDRLRGG